MTTDFDDLCRRVRQLQADGELPARPTDEQKADWAYGNVVIENGDVTLEMAKAIVAARRE